MIPNITNISESVLIHFGYCDTEGKCYYEQVTLDTTDNRVKEMSKTAMNMTFVVEI